MINSFDALTRTTLTGFEAIYFNSHAGGMAVARSNGFKIDFVRNLLSGSASWFHVIILKYIFKPSFWIKIQAKKSFHTEKFNDL